MSIPTTAELNLLRSRPHTTKLYLSIYQPKIVLTARVNDGGIAKGEREITYDNANWTTGWGYSSLKNGMVLLVGANIGDESKGRVRIKSATSTVITIAENSHINWADNDYLTVLNFYEINAVYPRIIQDPGDETKTLWYKDYDIVYTNQNTNLGSFVCMGSHYAGFTGNVYYTASGTLSLKSETLTYSWLFEGGNPTGSVSHTPGNVAYNTPGHYTTTLTVTTASGTADSSYRHISIYDRPGEGTNVPVLSWELQDLSGSRDQAGYVADIRLYQNLLETYASGTSNRPIVREGDLAIIFADDWYGADQATRQSIGGNCLNRSTIVFVGYVMKGSIQYNYRDSWVDFSLGSPTEIMRQTEGLVVSVQDDYAPDTLPSRNEDIPSSWVAVLNMDVKRAVYHFLRWHTTVMNCCDVIFKGTDRPIQYFDSDRTSIYDAVATFLQGAWMGNILCDRQGTIFCERDVYIEPTVYPSSFEMDKKDWIDDVTIDQSSQDRTSWIELGGIVYTGSTGTFTAVLSNAPGVSPGYRGKNEKQEGLALLSQSELNDISGAVWKHKNLTYPSIDINLAGNYRNYDIAPQEKIPLTIGLTDTIRGVQFTQKPFFINRMSWKYDSKTELFVPSASLMELATGSFAGDTVAIATIPETEGFYSAPFNFPSITIPPFPTINIGGVGGSAEARPTFIPAISNYANPHFHLYGYSYDWLGVGFADGSTVETAAVLYIPIDYEGTLTISHMIVANSAGTGDIHLETTIESFQDIDLDDIYTDAATEHYLAQAETVDVAGNQIAAVRTVTVDVLPDSFLWLDFIRNGSNIADTLAKTIVLLGWRIWWG